MKLNFYNQVLTPVLESISKYPHRNAFCIDETYYTYEMFSRRISAISEALDTCTFSKQQIGLVINDDLDTYWGKQAHSFIQNNPNTPCIKVKVKLSAIQVENNNSNN